MPKATKKYIPNSRRAVADAMIATIYKGKRIIRKYRSGEPLIGRIQEWNEPRYTGFVRGYGKKVKL